MHFADLGTLVIEEAGTVRTFRRSKQATLLALLVLNANRRVGVDDLVEAGWGRPTSTASVENQVWRLRRALQPASSPDSVIVHDDGGYRLVVDPDRVDSLRFEKLVSAARVLLVAGEPERALEEADQALALWRGRPYEVLEDYPPAMAPIARLVELDAQLQETRIESLLSLRRWPEALAGVEPLVAASPFREHLWAQRMRALAGAGRTVEALEVYRQIRRLLVEQTGLEPGAELQRLHRQLLRRDVDTPPVGFAPETPDPGAPTSVRLPARLNALIGREVELERISMLLNERPLVTIAGPGGTGKTRLAVELAARLAERFPDGLWFVDLTTATEPAQVAEVIASTLGLGAASVSDPRRSLVGFLRGRRVLLVLDNCEHVVTGVGSCVTTILAAEAGPVVLATSREPLEVDGETIWSLAPLANLARAGGMTPAEQLFVERAQAVSPELQVGADQLEQIRRICRSVDGLPLAIELAAARARSLSLSEIADQVAEDPSRLSRFGRSGDHHQDLYRSIEWSYRLLSPSQQRLHRQLSVLPGVFTADAAAGAAGRPRDDIIDELLGLTHRSLVMPSRGRGQRSSFSQLATVRAHAHRRLVAADEWAETLQRREAWVAALLGRRPRLGSSGTATWYDELEDAYPIVRDSLQRAVAAGVWSDLISLGSALPFFWYFRSRTLEGCLWLDKVSELPADPGRSATELPARLQVAASLLLRFNPEVARPQLAVLLPLVGQTPSALTEVVTESLVGVALGAWTCRQFDLVEVAGQAIEWLAARTSDDHVRLLSDAVACIAALRFGPSEGTGRLVEEVFDRAQQAGNDVVLWLTALVRCVVAAEGRNTVDALAWTQRVAGVQLALGAGGSKVFLETLANCLAANRDLVGAASLYSAACRHVRRSGGIWPEHPKTVELYHRVRSQLTPDRFREAWRDGKNLTLQDLADVAAAPRRSIQALSG